VNLSAPFIRRPIATSLIATAFLLVGVICYVRLPVAPLPQVDSPTIQVSASLPGGSPETMASSVAAPLERQFSQIPGVTQLTSISSLGSTSVALQFKLSRNIDAAAQDVQAAINAAGGQLPTNLPSPPSIRKINPADGPVFVLALESATLPLSTVSDYADNVVAQKLSRIDGVGQAFIPSPLKPAIRIRVDPRRAAALGIPLDAIRNAIAVNTVNAPKGQFNGSEGNVTIYANDQVLDQKGWDQLIVGYSKGAPVRIHDLGGAILDVENNQSGSFISEGTGKGSDPDLKSGRGVIVLVIKQPGANVIQTVAAIKAALPGIEASIPPSIGIHIIEDKTQTIRASINDVELTLLITVALVVGVIFLFLRDIRATLIPSAIIPLALLADAAVMLPAGFSLDNLSLMALTIAVGFVVDDAIVMVEAIWRRIEHGETPFQAALNGAGEIGFTIVTISVSLIAVFTPLMFMGGVVGLLMREFALTLSAAVMLSVIISLTVTPMLAAKFLRPPAPPRRRVMKALETGFRRLEKSYLRALNTVMRHMRLTLIVFISTAACAILLYATSPTGFFPQQDTGFIQGTIVLAQNASFDQAMDKCREVLGIITADPAAPEGHCNVSGNVSQTGINVALLPTDQGRRVTSDQIIARLRPRLAQVVGAQTVLQSAQDINIGARQSRAQFQYTLSDGNLDELNEWTPKVVEALAKLPQLKDVSSDQQSTAPSAMLVIDRDAAGRFGISPSDIDSAIYNQVGQRQVAQYYTQLNAYHVVLEAPPDLQIGPALLRSIYIKSPLTGMSVPLSLLVRIDTSQLRSLSISHQGQFPASTVSFNITPGVPLSEATTAISTAVQDLGAPVGLVGSFQGTAAAFQDSLATMPVLIIAALISVYIILGVLYESYIHPLTILSTLPSAGVGALLALKIAGMDLNIIGIIAIILLIGIVKKNGIMIVDVALKLEREEGLTPEESVVRASLQRFRPILMTTACALLGGVPMILSSGMGSEFRRPLGWAIVGGLLVSQVLTLFTTPVVYIYLDRFNRRKGLPGPMRILNAPSGAISPQAPEHAVAEL
jgi:HAE1 family hydrophobic/amphiphilic exporter-1